jgi:hypothetical protein
MVIRELAPGDASAFRALRIRALSEHPEAFGRTPEELDSVEVWTERLRVDAGSERDCLLGAFDGARLVGVALMALAVDPTSTAAQPRGLARGISP